MEQFNLVTNKLKELNIAYEVVEHPPVFTTEDADRFIEGKEGVRTKTMFLTNKKKSNFYLVIMDEAKRLDMKLFKELVEESQIKMASEEHLHTKILLPPGTVSPFGLLNNEEHDVQVYIDEEIVPEEIVCFHPNIIFKNNGFISFSGRHRSSCTCSFTVRKEEGFALAVLPLQLFFHHSSDFNRISIFFRFVKHSIC